MGRQLKSGLTEPSAADMYRPMSAAVGGFYANPPPRPAPSQPGEPPATQRALGLTSVQLHQHHEEGAHQKKRMGGAHGLNSHGSETSMALYSRNVGEPNNPGARRTSVTNLRDTENFSGALGRTSHELGQAKVSSGNRRRFDASSEPTGADEVIYGREHPTTKPVRGVFAREGSSMYAGALGKASRPHAVAAHEAGNDGRR